MGPTEERPIFEPPTTEEEALCVAMKDGEKLDGKQLINAAQHRLTKALVHIRQVYTKQVKYGAAMTNVEREEFTGHLISNDWDSYSFERTTATERSAGAAARCRIPIGPRWPPWDLRRASS